MNMFASSDTPKPDQRNHQHGMTEQELGLAKKLEEAAYTQQLVILDKMGVKGITRNTLLVKAKNFAMKQKRIKIQHIFDMAQPDQGGWFFYEGDRLRVVLGHPFIQKDGRIKCNVREIL